LAIPRCRMYEFSQPYEPYIETSGSFYMSFGPNKLADR
jgi:hypothetical protein